MDFKDRTTKATEVTHRADCHHLVLKFIPQGTSSRFFRGFRVSCMRDENSETTHSNQNSNMIPTLLKAGKYFLVWGRAESYRAAVMLTRFLNPVLRRTKTLLPKTSIGKIKYFSNDSTVDRELQDSYDGLMPRIRAIYVRGESSENQRCCLWETVLSYQ